MNNRLSAVILFVATISLLIGAFQARFRSPHPLSSSVGWALAGLGMLVLAAGVLQWAR